MKRASTPRKGPGTPRKKDPIDVDAVENWLAQHVSQCCGLYAPEASPVRMDPAISTRSRSVARRRNNGENSLAKTHTRTIRSRGVDSDNLTPRVYSEIGDCLTHKGAIVQHNRRQAAEELQTQEKQKTNSRMSKVVGRNSREIVNKMKMRRVVELYDALDPLKVGHIDLSELDTLMMSLSPAEIEFLDPFLREYGETWNTDTMAMEEFVAQMVVVMRNKDCTWGPLSALSSRRSSKRAQRAEQELEEERHAKLCFKPNISEKSQNLVQTQRLNRGVHNMSQQERLSMLSNERAMWGQRRDALERKKEAEEMSQCTFTPTINPSRFTPSGKRSGKPTYMQPLKQVHNALSSEEREVLTHCTFTPDTSLSKAIRRPGSAVRTSRMSARKPPKSDRPPLATIVNDSRPQEAS